MIDLKSKMALFWYTITKYHGPKKWYTIMIYYHWYDRWWPLLKTVVHFYLHRKMQVIGLVLLTLCKLFKICRARTTILVGLELLISQILDPDFGPWLGTLIWNPNLRPRIGTPNLDPNMGPPFGTPILDPDLDLDLGHPHLGPRLKDPNLGPRFGTLIWDPDLGPRFGTPIWDPDFGTLIGDPDWRPWFGTLVWDLIWNPN
jgi:hypothetical protein